MGHTNTETVVVVAVVWIVVVAVGTTHVLGIIIERATAQGLRVAGVSFTTGWLPRL